MVTRRSSSVPTCVAAASTWTVGTRFASTGAGQPAVDVGEGSAPDAIQTLESAVAPSVGEDLRVTDSAPCYLRRGAESRSFRLRPITVALLTVGSPDRAKLLDSLVRVAKVGLS